MRRTAGLTALLSAGLVHVSFDLITLIQYASYAAVGGLLAIRRPRNVIGWLLIGIAIGFIGTTTPPWVDFEALQAGTAAASDFLGAWFGTWAGGATFLLFAAVALTFPGEHLPQGRWRRPIVASLVLGIVVVAIPAFLRTLTVSLDGETNVAFPNPIGFLPDVPEELVPLVQLIVTLVPMVMFVVAVVSLTRRYRRASGILRLQIRWLMASITFTVVSVVGGLTLYTLSGTTAGFAWIPALVAYPTIPIAVGVAVTRYRLFEIDRIVSRTIAYGAVTALLFAALLAVNLTLQGVLSSATGADPLAVATSTLVVAAMFQPVRRRIQSVVDRHFDRACYDAERTVEHFAGRLRDQLDLTTLAGELRRTVTDAVQPSHAAVWLRTDRAGSWMAGHR